MDTTDAALAAERSAVVDRPAPTWQLVLMLAWPVLAQQLLNLIVLLSDQFLAGHFQQVPLAEQGNAVSHQLAALGALAPGGVTSGLAALPSAEASWQIMAKQVAYQSAQTTANYLAWFISSYTVLVSAAGTALVSRFVGAGDWARANHATNQALLLGAGFGLGGLVVGLVVLDPLVALLQVHGAARGFAVEYLRPLLALLVFMVVEQAGIACLVGAGDTRTGLYVLGGVALLNLPLAWGFFWLFGFQGIALGTAVSHMLGCLAVVVQLARGRAGLRLRFAELWPDRDLIRRLLHIGVPAGFDSLSVATAQLWFLSIVNQLGDTATAAHGIALRWEALAYLSGAAFGTAAMALVGQNLGAGRPREASHSGWTAFGIGCGLMCAMAVVFYVFAPEMFLVFCPRPEQAGVIREGVPVLRLVAFAVPAMASCIIFTGALRGAGDTRIPVLFTWIGFLGVRIPLAYYLTLPYLDLGPVGVWPGADLGLFGAWLAMFADLMVRGAFFLYRFASGRWQMIQV